MIDIWRAGMRGMTQPAGVIVTLVALVAGGIAAPAQADAPVPASPTNLTATNDSASITLTWNQPATAARPVSFRVYEGSAIVARNTTTHVVVKNLAFSSTHTYSVTAVGSDGRESTPSTPLTRRVLTGGAFACGLTVPSGFAVTDITASAISLSWSNAIPYYDRQGTLVLLENSAVILTTSLDSARIGGLAPASTHTFQVARRDCQGQLHASAPLTVTTAQGGSARPSAPTALTTGTRTASSIALSWTSQAGTDPAVRYAVYEGANRVATTSSTARVVTGLWRDTAHEYTVAALDSASNESAHSAPVQTATQPCAGSVPAPVGLTATATAPSSVSLSWVQIAEATSFTVYGIGADGQSTGPVTTATTTTSAMVTGLPSSTVVRYAVVAGTAGCGQSPLSTPAMATTLAGPTARPAPPADLSVVSRTPNPDFTGTLTLAWTQPSSDDPPVSFRLYEGTAVLGAGTTTGVTLRLPGGPTHSVTVVAVDAAGNESSQSPPVAFTVPFIPIP
jgi:fibronectin type 3 domain-containing protein